MKKIFLLPAFLCSFFCGLVTAQQYDLSWSTEINISNNPTDLDIVTINNSGLYLTEAKNGYKYNFWWGFQARSKFNLIKLDKNYTKVFDREYTKSLKGLAFHSFQALGEDLFLFATEFQQKAKTYKLYGAKINPVTGELASDLIVLKTYTVVNIMVQYNTRIEADPSGTSLMAISDLSENGISNYNIVVFDKDLKEKENITINRTLVETNTLFYVIGSTEREHLHCPVNPPSGSCVLQCEETLLPSPIASISCL